MLEGNRLVYYLSHKNNLYKQVHATMWIHGQPVDLHDKMAKSLETIATAITDLREVLIEGMILRQDDSLFNIGYGAYCNKMTSKYVVIEIMEFMMFLLAT